MADPALISTSVKAAANFANATKPTPVISMMVKPDVIPQIIANLEKLKGRTDDSEIVQKGTVYSFVDKRNGMPLAELDSSSAKLTMYKSPKDMAERIDSNFISEKTIAKFIEDSRVPGPAAMVSGMQMAALAK